MFLFEDYKISQLFSSNFIVICVVIELNNPITLILVVNIVTIIILN